MFKLGEFTKLTEGISATMTWAANGHLDAHEHAERVATGADGAIELKDALGVARVDVDDPVLLDGQEQRGKGRAWGLKEYSAARNKKADILLGAQA